jgi:hypothetical protein
VTLSKSELSRLRKEHQKYRERWSPVEKALGGLHPEDRSDFLKVAQAVASGDVEQHSRAAQWMRSVADQLSPAEKAAVAEAVKEQQQAPAPEEEFDPFDPDQIDARVKAEAEKIVDEKLSAREQKQQVEEATARIVSTAKELGYNTDPRDPMYGLLLLTARERFGGDLRRAHEAIESDLNNRATSILETKRADARQPTTPRTGAAAPAGQRKQGQSLRDVEESARERLNKILDGPG